MRGELETGVGIVYYILLGLVITLCIFIIFNFMRTGGLSRLISLLGGSFGRKIVGP